MSKKEKIDKENITQEGADINENIEASPDNIDSQVESLTAELTEEKNRFLRLTAEYDNFRKRTAKERAELYTDAVAKTIEDLLPVCDNFERALESETTDENFKKGTEMIFKQLSEYLSKHGVEEINPLGKEFDPAFAQAINQIEDKDLGENIVAQVFQKGYKLGDKIIRYAMVIVANP